MLDWVGRPCNIYLDDAWTLEVRRLVTNRYHNACSMLFGACWRATQAIGYRKLLTYTLPAKGAHPCEQSDGHVSKIVGANLGSTPTDQGMIPR